MAAAFGAAMKAGETIATVAAALLVPVAVAAGQYGPQPQPQPQQQQQLPPTAHVKAEGNAVTGGLKFDPASVTVPVGGVVQWTNTDNAVPHTATEDHGLWDLSGTYGSPGPYQGFGPGTSVQRTFEAGTQHYYCKVHPTQMHGVIAVPVTLKVVHKRDRRHRRYSLITATWSTQAPASGEVMDVERKMASGVWQPFREGTTTESATFRSKRGVIWTVHARLRKADDPKAATDWSPDAQIKA